MEQTKLQLYQEKVAPASTKIKTDYEIIKAIFIKNKIDYLATKHELIRNGVTLAFDAQGNLTEMLTIRRT